MDPIFVQIGPLAVRWYGLLIAAGVLVGALWALRLAEKRGLNPERLLDMALWLVIAGVIGARLVYVLTSPAAYFGPGGNPLDALKVWEGGISIHGGVIGVMVAMWLYCRRHGLDMWAYLDVLTPVGALGIIGGRIGNIMNGTDTGGRLTDLGIGFTWPEPGTETFGAFGRFLFGDQLWQFAPPACGQVPAGEACVVHFTQFYGVIVGLLLVAILAVALRRQTAASQAAMTAAGVAPAAGAAGHAATTAGPGGAVAGDAAKGAAATKPVKAPPQPRASKGRTNGPVRRERHFVPNPGYVFWLFVFWYSILRSVLEEPFRDNPLPWQVYLNEQAGIGLFTYTQLASIPLILLAAYLMLTSGDRANREAVAGRRAARPPAR